VTAFDEPGLNCIYGIDLKPYLKIITDGGTFFSIAPGTGIKIAF
jgi:hypothetical protein